jgi:hypothetical protein
MKKILILLFTFLLSIKTYAQETMGLDEKIDYFFGKSTGWFVEFIFEKIPISDGVGMSLGIVSIDFWGCFFYFIFQIS